MTETAKKPSVVLYTTHCPRCLILKKRLDDAKVLYGIVDDVDVMREKGMMTAPMLGVDGELLTYLEAIEWLKGVCYADTN